VKKSLHHSDECVAITLALTYVALAGATGAARASEAGPLAAQATVAADLDIAELLSLKVTTVSRSASTVGQSSAAVFVINEEMIRRSGATALPELLRMVPGLHVARIDGHEWAVASRGFNSRYAKNLLVQVDGRPVYNTEIAGVFWDSVDYPLADIERIEVVRGPGGSVWGANAVNGVINIVTKSAKETLGGFFSGGGGSSEQGFFTFRQGARIGDDLFFRVYGNAFDRGAQFSKEGESHDTWRSANGGVRLDWAPGEQNTLTLDGSFGRGVAETDDRFPLASGPPFAVNIPEEDTISTAHVLALWSHQQDAAHNWKLQAFWDFSLRTDTHHIRDTGFDTYDLDFQDQFPLGERHKFVWGLGYRYVQADLPNSRDDDSFYLDWLSNDPHIEIFSSFVQDEIILAEDRLNLTLGSKFEHNNFTGFEVQPSGRLLWSPTQRQSVWVAISRAVRTPSFVEHDVQLTLPSSNPNSPSVVRTVGNRGLQAEEVTAYELGHRVQATDNLSVDAAVFYNVHDHLRINRINPALATTVKGIRLAASQFDNGMSGETYGAELAANWRVTDWWRLHAAYSFLEIQLHRDPGLPASTESPEGQDPHHQLYLRSSWNLPHEVEFDLTGRYVDRLSGFNPTGIIGVQDSIPAYVSLDARLAWSASKNLTVEVVGQNLLENHHLEFGTNPFIRAPLVEIRRGVYARITCRW
jgi:iron complex outermembrane receptor protein